MGNEQKLNDYIQDVDNFLSLTKFNFEGITHTLYIDTVKNSKQLLGVYRELIANLSVFLDKQEIRINTLDIIEKYSTNEKSILGLLINMLKDYEDQNLNNMKSKKNKQITNKFIETIKSVYAFDAYLGDQITFKLYDLLFQMPEYYDGNLCYGERTFWLQRYFQNLLMIHPGYLENFDAGQNSVIEDPLLENQDSELEQDVLIFLLKNIKIAKRKKHVIQKYLERNKKDLEFDRKMYGKDKKTSLDIVEALLELN